MNIASGAATHSSADTLWVLFEKCARTAEAADWQRWREGPLVEDLIAGGAASVVCAEVTPAPAAGMPGVGFSHVTLARFGDRPGASPAAAIASLRSRGRIHDAAAFIDAQEWTAHGATPPSAAPADGLTGHILAQVMPTDPALVDEWDRWYDDTHLPDMLAMGAFADGSRWRRHPPVEVGANHLTLYDITSSPVALAVEQSAAGMPALIAAGRKHRTHVGALTVVLQATAVRN